jgi:hypothetical protein
MARAILFQEAVARSAGLNAASSPWRSSCSPGRSEEDPA